MRSPCFWRPGPKPSLPGRAEDFQEVGEEGLLHVVRGSQPELEDKQKRRWIRARDRPRQRQCRAWAWSPRPGVTSPVSRLESDPSSGLCEGFARGKLRLYVSPPLCGCPDLHDGSSSNRIPVPTNVCPGPGPAARGPHARLISSTRPMPMFPLQRRGNRGQDRLIE